MLIGQFDNFGSCTRHTSTKVSSCDDSLLLQLHGISPCHCHSFAICITMNPTQSCCHRLHLHNALLPHDVQGLYHTDNESVQAAAAYIFEQPSNAVNAPFDPELSDDGDDRDYKMVFVVNAGLGMGVGKIAAQVGSERQGMWSRLDLLPRGTGI